MFRWFSLESASQRFQFRCECCGQIHSGSPSFAYQKPVGYFMVPEEERDDRVMLTEDLCSIDDETFYIRGLLELPIEGVEEPFSWGLWISQSRESFERYVETFDQDQSGDGSFGWLPVTMPGYIDSNSDAEWESLACDVEWQGPGSRPIIVPHRSDHPLSRDHANGITWDRAIEMAQAVMHG